MGNNTLKAIQKATDKKLAAKKAADFAATINSVLNGADPIEAAGKLIEKSKTELPAPPAEIKLDLDALKEESPKIEDKKENTMETTEAPKTAKPTRAQLVALANDMNAVLIDCKIPTDKKYTVEVITNMITNKELEIVFSDVTPTNEGDIVFTHESIEAMLALGMTLPSAPVVKTDSPKTTTRKTKTTSDKFTRHDAVLQALDAMPADGQTFPELQKVIDDIMVARGNRSIVSTSCSEVLKFSLLSLIHFGKMSKDETSKKYTFTTAIIENA